MEDNIRYIFGGDVETFSSKIKQCLDDIYYNISTSALDELKTKVFSLYYFYPVLFKESFDDIQDEKLIDMCVLSVLCLDSCLYDDKILDGQQVITASQFHAHNLINIEIGKLSQKLLGDSELFWNYYYKYYQEYVQSTILERERHFGKIESYSKEEYLSISKGKQAMCKIIPAMFCCFQGDFTVLEDYERVIDITSSALQIYDDLRDWKTDFTAQRLSWILNSILYESGLNLCSDSNLVSDYLFDNEIDIHFLDISRRMLDEAMVISEKQLASTWYRYVRFLQNHVNRLMVDLLTIRGCSVVSLEYLYRNADTKTISLKKCLDRTLEFIIKQYEKNVADVKEWLLSYNPKVPEQIEVLGGDIFMRVQMFNLLKESVAVNDNRVKLILQKEIDYFISNKSSVYRYGWVYIEGLYGNCPDLDTFSEMLRIANCKYASGTTLQPFVSRILEKVLKNNNNPYFNTWIIDADEPDYDFLIHNFTMTGDLEVTANMIKSLNSIDPIKYKKRIEQSLSWVEGKQTKEGFWNSTWYVGNYYCGYLLSCLSNVKSFSTCYQRFLNYLYESQNKNGSWGDGCGNPLDTAYALYSIAEAADINGQKEKTVIKKGLYYLLSTRDTNGFWFSCEFIKMGKGKSDISYQSFRYKSVTLTTIYCFAALSKVYKIFGE